MKEENIIPPILYKYRELSNKYHLQTLFEGKLYLANPYSFNDPFEGNNKTRWDKLSYQDCLNKNEQLFASLLKNLKPNEKTN